MRIVTCGMCFDIENIDIHPVQAAALLHNGVEFTEEGLGKVIAWALEHKFGQQRLIHRETLGKDAAIDLDGVRGTCCQEGTDLIYSWMECRRDESEVGLEGATTDG